MDRIPSLKYNWGDQEKWKDRYLKLSTDEPEAFEEIPEEYHIVYEWENGWLDYSQWECPPYRQEYYDESINLPNNYIVISNRYNLDHGELPIGYYDIECLNEIFNYLRSIGLDVIYKRPRNTEFTRDPNELLNLNIELNGLTDYDLTEKHSNVFIMDNLIEVPICHSLPFIEVCIGRF